MGADEFADRLAADGHDVHQIEVLEERDLAA